MEKHLIVPKIIKFIFINILLLLTSHCIRDEAVSYYYNSKNGVDAVDIYYKERFLEQQKEKNLYNKKKEKLIKDIKEFCMKIQHYKKIPAKIYQHKFYKFCQ